MSGVRFSHPAHMKKAPLWRFFHVCGMSKALERFTWRIERRSDILPVGKIARRCPDQSERRRALSRGRFSQVHRKVPGYVVADFPILYKKTKDLPRLRGKSFFKKLVGGNYAAIAKFASDLPMFRMCR